jgi:tetratricopeptide (TPR) repeat protein
MNTSSGVLSQDLDTLKILEQAVTLHQAGRWSEAELIYREILQLHPFHPDANHNLGILAIQVKQPEAGLSYLKAALDASPNVLQYLLSYIEALVQAGQCDVAKKLLEEGKRRGLEGQAVEQLTRYFDDQLNSNRCFPEEGILLKKYAEGRYREVIGQANELTRRFPGVGLYWKVLGAALIQSGRNAEAIGPTQKAAELAPNDAEVHNNANILLTLMIILGTC